MVELFDVERVCRLPFANRLGWQGTALHILSEYRDVMINGTFSHLLVRDIKLNQTIIKTLVHLHGWYFNHRGKVFPTGTQDPSIKKWWIEVNQCVKDCSLSDISKISDLGISENMSTTLSHWDSRCFLSNLSIMEFTWKSSLIKLPCRQESYEHTKSWHRMDREVKCASKRLSCREVKSQQNICSLLMMWNNHKSMINVFSYIPIIDL